MSYETIHQTILSSQVAVHKSTVEAFLRHNGWTLHRTSDNREYWNKNAGTLCTIEQAFKQELEKYANNKVECQSLSTPPGMDGKRMSGNLIRYSHC